MPDTFAHFVLVHFASAKLRGHKQVKIAVNKFNRFALLGANSPDFPMLDFPQVFFDNKWENLLHGPTAGAIIEPAIQLLRSITEEQRQRCLAWFCGYLSHMVFDATIHPVVNLRVGPYDEGNQVAHQTCEVHQDAYIFPRLNIGSIKEAEFTNIIETCSSPHNNLALHEEINDFWESITRQAFPQEDLPNFHRWFYRYTGIVDNLAEEADQKILDWDWTSLHSWAQRAGKAHLLHVNPKDLDRSFIDDLPTPNDGTLSYDEIFDKAVENTVAAWAAVDIAISNTTPLPYPLSAIWNLNTGITAGKNFLYW